MWTKKNNLLIYLVILALILNFSCVISKRDKKEECKTCKEIVEAFYKVSFTVLNSSIVMTLIFQFTVSY